MRNPNDFLRGERPVMVPGAPHPPTHNEQVARYEALAQASEQSGDQDAAARYRRLADALRGKERVAGQ
jgi:hypothetical protein